MQMDEMIKQFQNIFVIDLSLKPSVVLKINDAIPNSEQNTIAYVIEHYSAIAKNLSSNERQDLRKALKEVGVPDGLLPGKGRPKHDDSIRDLNLVGRPIEEDAPDEELESPVEFEEPKESALKKSAEQVKESVKVLTDYVKDVVSETISENVIVDEPIAIDKEAFDPHITISSEQIKEVGITTDEHMDIFQCMDDIKKINEGIKNLQSTIQELENEKKRLKDRVAELLDEV